jgi:hypothetical protein
MHPVSCKLFSFLAGRAPGADVMARPTKTTLDYFPHQCTHGKTIAILESKWGNDGYAFWFKLLEVIGTTSGLHLDFRDESLKEFLSAKTHLDGETVVNILDTLAKVGAIDVDLWKCNCVFSENFIANIADAYRRRKELLPSKTLLMGVYAGSNPPKRGKEKEKEKEKEILKPCSSDDELVAGFNLFWSVFNYKIGKQPAFESWKKIKDYDADLLAVILAGAEREAARRPALIANKKTPKMAQGWLTDKRWTDEGMDEEEIERPEHFQPLGSVNLPASYFEGLRKATGVTR